MLRLEFKLLKDEANKAHELPSDEFKRSGDEPAPLDDEGVNEDEGMTLEEVAKLFMDDKGSGKPGDDDEEAAALLGEEDSPFIVSVLLRIVIPLL
jgi:hypothetical protein